MTGKIIKGIAGFYYVNDGENRGVPVQGKRYFQKQEN